MGKLSKTFPPHYSHQFFKRLIDRFSWLHWVLVVAPAVLFWNAGSFSCWHTLSFSCNIWDLVLWPGIEPSLHALVVLNLSHWITREVPPQSSGQLPFGVIWGVIPSLLWLCCLRSLTSSCKEEGKNVWEDTLALHPLSHKMTGFNSSNISVVRSESQICEYQLSNNPTQASCVFRRYRGKFIPIYIKNKEQVRI